MREGNGECGEGRGRGFGGGGVGHHGDGVAGNDSVLRDGENAALESQF